jgi:hypothetical protein
MRKILILLLFLFILFPALHASCIGEWGFYNSAEGGTCCKGLAPVSRVTKTDNNLCNSSLGTCNYQCQPTHYPLFENKNLVTMGVAFLVGLAFFPAVIFNLIYYLHFVGAASKFISEKYPRKYPMVLAYGVLSRTLWIHIPTFPHFCDENRDYKSESIHWVAPIPNKQPFISMIRNLRIGAIVVVGIILLFIFLTSIS